MKENSARVDTRVIRVKGWVESEEEKEQGASPWREEQNDWNLNNHIKPAAFHSLISIDSLERSTSRKSLDSTFLLRSVHTTSACILFLFFLLSCQ